MPMSCPVTKALTARKPDNSNAQVSAHPSPDKKGAILLENVGRAALQQAVAGVLVTFALAALLTTGRVRNFRRSLHVATWTVALASLSFFAFILGAAHGVFAQFCELRVCRPHGLPKLQEAVLALLCCPHRSAHETGRLCSRQVACSRRLVTHVVGVWSL
jgi:hypothetical protein